MASMEELEAFLDNEAVSQATSNNNSTNKPSTVAYDAQELAGKRKSSLHGWSPGVGAHKSSEGLPPALSLGESMDTISHSSSSVEIAGISSSGTSVVTQAPFTVVSGSGETSASVSADGQVQGENAGKSKKQLKREAKRLAQAQQKLQHQHSSKPKLTKQERRELQEKQRAEKEESRKAKATAGAEKHGKHQENKLNAGGKTLQYDDSKRMAKKSKAQIVHRTLGQKQMALFSHLPQYETERSLSADVGAFAASSSNARSIHPAILRLGLKYSDHLISGANARAVAVLDAFKLVIKDHSAPADRAFSRDLDKSLKPMIQFLTDCRPMSITMGNAIKYVRAKIMNIPPEVPAATAKERLVSDINDFIRTQIVMAQSELVKRALPKIVDGDVILTYSRSHVVEKLLLQAHENGVNFKVIVVGSRPGRDGEDLVKRLASRGLKCVFVVLSAVSYIMRQATKVVIGAGSMLSNGTMLSKTGTALVTAVAHSFNRPVLVCCETYKFSERVQLDSICSNELGDPDSLILASSRDGDANTQDPLSDWRDISCMKLLNLLFDVTPMESITVVVTEIGMIPPTSVPVIIRERAMFDESY